MKIDDVSLTIFTWDNIPATRYHLGRWHPAPAASACCAFIPMTAWRATPSSVRRPIRRRWMGRN